MKIKLGVHGASGRMGTQLLKVLSEFPQYELAAALVSEQSRVLDQPCGSGALRFSCDVARALKDCDAMLDFSTPRASLPLARLCATERRPLLIATTGHDPGMLEELKALANRIPLMLVPNTSIGIFTLRELALQTRKYLGENFDIEILELHHRYKQDRPSGTALDIGQALAKKFDLQVPISSVRGGDVIGEHTVYFLGNGERLELTHKVSDRAVFARGALKILLRMISNPPGLYQLEHIFAA